MKNLLQTFTEVISVATFTPRKKPSPIKIDRFLGINEAVGDTEVSVGEWISGFNARVTKDYKIEKRPGHYTYINFGVGDVQGQWFGTIGGTQAMILCWNGNVYEYDTDVVTTTTAIATLISEGTVTILGTITDAKTNIFWFEDIVYFINGTDYKQYNGTTYADVVGYVPTVALSAPPSGGGTLFEEINLISGYKTQTFVGNGSSALYQLAEATLDATLVTATVNGVAQVETVDFTVNRTLGQVTFVVIPPNLATVSITWNKVESGNADLIKNHKYSLVFGVNADTNIFLYGNVNERNVFRFSGIGDATYFPTNSFVGVGSTEFAITSLVPQYQSLLVFKYDSTKLVNPTVNANYSANTGLNPYDYGYQGLDDSIGNKAPNMVQLVGGNPVSLDGVSLRHWVSTTGVKNEVEPNIISDRLQLSLESLNLETAVTFDYEKKKELWVNIDNTVYIWNYGNDTMYKYDNIQAVGYLDVNGELYYSGSGTVEHVSSDYLADGAELGTNIALKLYGGFLDFNSLQYRKMMANEWLSIRPDTRTSVEIMFITDRKNEDVSKWYEVEYKLIDFADIDFDDFSFLTNRSAQVNRIKGKIKKFTYIQWVLRNDTNDETLVVLKLLMQAQTQGYSR